MHAETVLWESDSMPSVKGNTGSACQNRGRAGTVKSPNIQVVIPTIQNLGSSWCSEVALRQIVYTVDNKLVWLAATGNCGGRQHQQVQGIGPIAGQQVQKWILTGLSRNI